MPHLPSASGRQVVAIVASLLALAALEAVAGCDTIHGAGQASNGGSGGAVGMTLPIPGLK